MADWRAPAGGRRLRATTGGKPSSDGAHCMRARGVAFSYGSKQVLASMDLEVAQGELCCLIGVNGCGKSTFLDCVLGINEPDAGSVELDGRPILEMGAAERARMIAYVPQVHDRSFPYRVKDIVLMGRTAYQRGLASPDAQDREIAQQTLEASGIAELADRPFTQLSGGEMQMVVLARALVQQTPFLLMDEPTAHLDFRNEMQFLETVVQLARERAAGILMATHAPNQAFFLQESGIPTKVALMDGGKVAMLGTPDETLTEESLEATFGIKARVLHDRLDDGHEISRIMPLSTVKEASSRNTDDTEDPDGR